MYNSEEVKDPSFVILENDALSKIVFKKSDGTFLVVPLGEVADVENLIHVDVDAPTSPIPGKLWFDLDEPFDINADGAVTNVGTTALTSAIINPADSPATADALRDDLVTNTIVPIRSAITSLGAKVNDVLASLRIAGVGVGVLKTYDAVTESYRTVQSLGTERRGRWTPPAGRYLPVVSVPSATVMTAALNRIYFVPWEVLSDGTILELGVRLSAASTAGGLLRVGVFNTVAGLPGALLLDAGTVATDSGSNNKFFSLSLDVSPRLVWGAVCAQGQTASIQGATIASPFVGDLTNLQMQGAGYQQSAVTGAFPAFAAVDVAVPATVPQMWERR